MLHSFAVCRFSWKRVVVEMNHIWQGCELECLRRTALKSSAALVCVGWSLPAVDHLETTPPKGRKQSRVTACLTQNNHVKVLFLGKKKTLNVLTLLDRGKQAKSLYRVPL